MAMNLGINLLETNGTATPAIQGAPTSTTGFIVRSARGVPGAVRQITMFADFNKYFGGYSSSAFGAYCVKGFFDNQGSMAFVTRAVFTGTAAGGATPAAPASVTLDSGSGAGATPELTVSAGYRGSADPGLWGNALSVGVTANADGTFNLLIFNGGKQVEAWNKLKVGGTGSQDPNQLNDQVAGSEYVTVTVASGAAANPSPTQDSSTPPKFTPVALTNGADDNLDNSTNSAAGGARDLALQNALPLFDPHAVQLLCIPETTTASVVQAALTYCQNRGDCMFIGHTPQNNDVTAAKTYGQGLQADKVYGAIYFPFIRVSNPIGGYIWIPGDGHVAGVYARTALERGIWKAPAGSAASVENAVDIAYSISDVQHTDLVKNGSVNAIRNIAGEGIVIDSSRTLSTNPLWLYVNVRQLFNYVKSSLKYGLRWTVQEPNDQTLWNKANYNSITPFLMGLYRRGAFGPGKPTDVFTVKIDAENNPSANIQQGIFTVDVFFYPSRPAETVVITVGQQDSGASAGES
jgi:phage tail sheath protein FI